MEMTQDNIEKIKQLQFESKTLLDNHRNQSKERIGFQFQGTEESNIRTIQEEESTIPNSFEENQLPRSFQKKGLVKAPSQQKSASQMYMDLDNDSPVKVFWRYEKERLKSRSQIRDLVKKQAAGLKSANYFSNKYSSPSNVAQKKSHYQHISTLQDVNTSTVRQQSLTQLNIQHSKSNIDILPVLDKSINQNIERQERRKHLMKQLAKVFDPFQNSRSSRRLQKEYSSNSSQSLLPSFSRYQNSRQQDSPSFKVQINRNNANGQRSQTLFDQSRFEYFDLKSVVSNPFSADILKKNNTKILQQGKQNIRDSLNQYKQILGSAVTPWTEQVTSLHLSQSNSHISPILTPGIGRGSTLHEEQDGKESEYSDIRESYTISKHINNPPTAAHHESYLSQIQSVKNQYSSGGVCYTHNSSYNGDKAGSSSHHNSSINKTKMEIHMDMIDHQRKQIKDQNFQRLLIHKFDRQKIKNIPKLPPVYKIAPQSRKLNTVDQTVYKAVNRKIIELDNQALRSLRRNLKSRTYQAKVNYPSPKSKVINHNNNNNNRFNQPRHTINQVQSIRIDQLGRNLTPVKKNAQIACTTITLEQQTDKQLRRPPSILKSQSRKKEIKRSPPTSPRFIFMNNNKLIPKIRPNTQNIQLQNSVGVGNQEEIGTGSIQSSKIQQIQQKGKLLKISVGMNSEPNQQSQSSKPAMVFIPEVANIINSEVGSGRKKDPYRTLSNNSNLSSPYVRQRKSIQQMKRQSSNYMDNTFSESSNTQNKLNRLTPNHELQNLSKRTEISRIKNISSIIQRKSHKGQDSSSKIESQTERQAQKSKAPISKQEACLDEDTNSQTFGQQKETILSVYEVEQVKNQKLKENNSKKEAKSNQENNITGWNDLNQSPRISDPVFVPQPYTAPLESNEDSIKQLQHSKNLINSTGPSISNSLNRFSAGRFNRYPRFTVFVNNPSRSSEQNTISFSPQLMDILMNNQMSQLNSQRNGNDSQVKQLIPKQKLVVEEMLKNKIDEPEGLKASFGENQQFNQDSSRKKQQQRKKSIDQSTITPKASTKSKQSLQAQKVRMFDPFDRVSVGKTIPNAILTSVRSYTGQNNQISDSFRIVHKNFIPTTPIRVSNGSKLDQILKSSKISSQLLAGVTSDSLQALIKQAYDDNMSQQALTIQKNNHTMGLRTFLNHQETQKLQLVLQGPALYSSKDMHQASLYNPLQIMSLGNTIIIEQQQDRKFYQDQQQEQDKDACLSNKDLQIQTEDGGQIDHDTFEMKQQQSPTPLPPPAPKAIKPNRTTLAQRVVATAPTNNKNDIELFNNSQINPRSVNNTSDDQNQNVTDRLLMSFRIQPSNVESKRVLKNQKQTNQSPTTYKQNANKVENPTNQQNQTTKQQEKAKARTSSGQFTFRNNSHQASSSMAPTKTVILKRADVKITPKTQIQISHNHKNTYSSTSHSPPLSKYIHTRYSSNFQTSPLAAKKWIKTSARSSSAMASSPRANVLKSPTPLQNREKTFHQSQQRKSSIDKETKNESQYFSNEQGIEGMRVTFHQALSPKEKFIKRSISPVLKVNIVSPILLQNQISQQYNSKKSDEGPPKRRVLKSGIGGSSPQKSVSPSSKNLNHQDTLSQESSQISTIYKPITSSKNSTKVHFSRTIGQQNDYWRKNQKNGQRKTWSHKMALQAYSSIPTKKQKVTSSSPTSAMRVKLRNKDDLKLVSKIDQLQQSKNHHHHHHHHPNHQLQQNALGTTFSGSLQSFHTSDMGHNNSFRSHDIQTKRKHPVLIEQGQQKSTTRQPDVKNLDLKDSTIQQMKQQDGGNQMTIAIDKYNTRRAKLQLAHPEQVSTHLEGSGLVKVERLSRMMNPAYVKESTRQLYTKKGGVGGQNRKQLLHNNNVIFQIEKAHYRANSPMKLKRQGIDKKKKQLQQQQQQQGYRRNYYTRNIEDFKDSRSFNSINNNNNNDTEISRGIGEKFSNEALRDYPSYFGMKRGSL